MFLLYYESRLYPVNGILNEAAGWSHLGRICCTMMALQADVLICAAHPESTDGEYLEMERCTEHLPALFLHLCISFCLFYFFCLCLRGAQPCTINPVSDRQTLVCLLFFYMLPPDAHVFCCCTCCVLYLMSRKSSLRQMLEVEICFVWCENWSQEPQWFTSGTEKDTMALVVLKIDKSIRRNALTISIGDWRTFLSSNYITKNIN